MKVIDQSFKILTPMYYFHEITRHLELCGRVCYKSENMITNESADKFIKNITKSGHESVLEHASITVKFICDRGLSHEIVRHRIASYSQESTRYCNYKSKDIVVINPGIEDPKSYNLWYKTVKQAADCYLKLINLDIKPQHARSVLPISLKTEVIVTMNLREWRHFFKMRTINIRAHPQLRKLTLPLLKEFKISLPAIFGDIK